MFNYIQMTLKQKLNDPKMTKKGSERKRKLVVCLIVESKFEQKFSI